MARKSKFTEEEIVSALKQVEVGDRDPVDRYQ